MFFELTVLLFFCVCLCFQNVEETGASLHLREQLQCVGEMHLSRHSLRPTGKIKYMMCHQFLSKWKT